MVDKGLIHHIFTPLRNFFKDSRAVGVVLILCTIISLVLANLSSTQLSYTSFWQNEIHLNTGLIHLPGTNLDWVNDMSMTFFFFLVGMEIKRELSVGELASVKKSLLPIIAALGGMVVPALIFILFNSNTPFHHGWGIPMATDIAFSLAVLSLLGKKVPIQLKIFLAALAIIDDLGAVITIAIFYTSKLHLLYLLGASGAFGVVLMFNKLKIKQTHLYLIPGIIMWYCLFNSGIHATISGVVMAFTLPLSKLATLERILFRPVNFVIMPLFALANTAIIFPSDPAAALTSTVSLGVIFGLFIGKPLGIFLFSFMAVKSKVAALPSRTTFRQLIGIGMLGGIGFTMSIFTTSLAFTNEAVQVISKVSIISASLLAGIAGFTYLYRLKPVLQSVPEITEERVPETEEEFQPAYLETAGG
ncbi:MAG: Na+/H+ antiporter NhaA [Chitinophagaceae bacterium]